MDTAERRTMAASRSGPRPVPKDGVSALLTAIRKRAILASPRVHTVRISDRTGNMDTGLLDTGAEYPYARRSFKVENGATPTRDAPKGRGGLRDLCVTPANARLRGDRRGGSGAEQDRRTEERIKHVLG